MRVLFLTHRLPFAPNRGDRVRAYHTLNLLAERAEVHVVSLVHDRAEEAEVERLRPAVRVSTALVPRLRNLASAARALSTTRPLTHVLLDAPAMQPAVDRVVEHWKPDVVLAYCTGVAPFAPNPSHGGIPLVVDLVDVDSAKWDAFADAAAFPKSWLFRREARCLGAFERRIVREAFAATVVNERERDTLLRTCPDARVHVVPNGVDVVQFAPHDPPAAEDHVVFTGVFNYAPNADGAIWFSRHVWPLVRAARPRAKLTLAGASPTRAVRQLAEQDASIEVTGSVADIRPYLWRAALSVAPIFQARGVQNKVLEAAAAGLPSVVTKAVWEGLPVEVRPACRMAESPAHFATKIGELLALAPGGRRREAARARLSELTWSRRLAPMLQLLESAAERPPRAATA